MTGPKFAATPPAGHVESISRAAAAPPFRFMEESIDEARKHHFAVLTEVGSLARCDGLIEKPSACSKPFFAAPPRP